MTAYTPVYGNAQTTTERGTTTEGTEKENILVFLNFGHAGLYLTYRKHNSGGISSTHALKFADAPRTQSLEGKQVKWELPSEWKLNFK